VCVCVYSDLVMVVALSRHGSRAPKEITRLICPNNVKNLDSYTVPLQQLTELGMQQMLAAGEQTRKTYIEDMGFMTSEEAGSTTARLQTYFQAEASEGCGQSAVSFGYGLYPGKPDDASSEDRSFDVPVPVVMQLGANEHDFSVTQGPCKDQMKKDDQIFGAEDAPRILNQYEALWSKLGDACGFDMADIPNVSGDIDELAGINSIASMLHSDKEQGFPLLKGIDDSFYNEIQQVAFSTKMKRRFKESRQVTYWVGGFSDLLMNTLNSPAGRNSADDGMYKLYSYNVQSDLLHGLGIMLGWQFDLQDRPVDSTFNTSALLPGATMYFELHSKKVSDGENHSNLRQMDAASYFINTFLWTPQSSRTQVKLNKCSSIDCPLEEFNGIMTGFIQKTGSWEDICQYKQEKKVKDMHFGVADGSRSDFFENYSSLMMGGVLILCTLFAMHTAVRRINQFKRTGYTAI